jgi:hypothetical protein
MPDKRNPQIEVINTVEEVKDLFENGGKYIRTHRRRRAAGGDNLSKQLVIENVIINAPIVIGQPAQYLAQSVSEIPPIKDLGLYGEYSHLVFNSGEFESLQFDRYHLNPNFDEQTAYFPPAIKIEINGGEFSGPIRFSNSRIGTVIISGGIFHSEVCFERGVYGHVEISGGEFKRGLFFGQIVDFDKYTPFLPPPVGTPQWTSNDDGIFESIKFSGGNSVQGIVLRNCCIENSIEFSTKESDYLVSGLFIKNRLEVNQGSYSLTGCKCESVVIGANRSSGKILLDIAGSEFNAIYFQNYSSKDSVITLRNVQTNTCTFENFLNYGSLVFNLFSLANTRREYGEYKPNKPAQSHNLKAFQGAMFYAGQFGGQDAFNERIEAFKGALVNIQGITETESPSSFHLINSDLGKASYIESNISHSKLYYKNSKLTDIFLAGTSLPHYHDVMSSENSFQHRLALSQIRKVYENRGDSVTASEYQSQELEILRKNLRWKEDFFEKLPLTMHFKSSRHGQNWEPAFCWLFGGGFLLWLIICVLLFDMPRLNKESVIIFLASTSYFIQFLLPIHRFDLIDLYIKNVAGVQHLSNLNEWILPVAYGIDTICRLFSGYLVYQLIAAFRKHGKK